MQIKRKASQARFDPYEYNAGTSLGINTGDALILASDTRHSNQMGINSRSMSKIYNLEDYFLITTGFYADGYDIYLKMLFNLIEYSSKNNKSLSINSTAHLLHNLLYSKRFFPYYAYCILGGYDKKEKRFKLFSYDCVGSYAETKCRVDGSGASMVQPLLDSRISKLNFENIQDTDVTLDEVKSIVKVAFTGAAERDVRTGDFLEMIVVQKDGIMRTINKMRND